MMIQDWQCKAPIGRHRTVAEEFVACLLEYRCFQKNKLLILHPSLTRIACGKPSSSSTPNQSSPPPPY
jgi:hypothetical protein